MPVRGGADTETDTETDSDTDLLRRTLLSPRLADGLLDAGGCWTLRRCTRHPAHPTSPHPPVALAIHPVIYTERASHGLSERKQRALPCSSPAHSTACPINVFPTPIRPIVTLAGPCGFKSWLFTRRHVTRAV